eukprot:780505-Prymnesium_polylepis.1
MISARYAPPLRARSCPAHSYNTHTLRCVRPQEENWVDAVEPDVRQGDAAGLQGSEPMKEPAPQERFADGAAEPPPAVPCQQPAEALAGADAAVTAAV